MAVFQTRNHRLVAALVLALVVAAGIAIFSLNDDGEGRKAAIGDTAGTVAYVAAAGRNAGTCTSIAAPCATVTYALTKVAARSTIKVSGLIKDHVTIDKDVTITGTDATAAINGSDNGTVVVIPARTTTVTLDHLRIEHGRATTSTKAAGGISNAGILTLTSVTVSSNVAGLGNGIYNNYGSLTIKNSTISGNTLEPLGRSYGGGLYTSNGPVMITDSTISGNTAFYGGGILKADRASPLTIVRSTISGNTAITGGQGGGIWGNGVTVTATTMTGNRAPTGAAIYAQLEVQIYSSTIVGNTALGQPNCTTTVCPGTYGALFAASRGLTFTIGGSIIAKNTTENCQIGNTQPAAKSLGYNVTDDDGKSCSMTLATDVRNANPLLGALANNGGPTQTMLPAATSPALNRIPANTTLNAVKICPSTDQRGGARPKSGATKCAAGAIEP